MKILVKCPKCNTECDIVLEKTLPINKDILVKCPICKWLIPIRLFKPVNQVW